MFVHGWRSKAFLLFIVDQAKGVVFASNLESLGRVHLSTLLPNELHDLLLEHLELSGVGEDFRRKFREALRSERKGGL